MPSKTPLDDRAVEPDGTSRHGNVRGSKRRWVVSAGRRTMSRAPSFALREPTRLMAGRRAGGTAPPRSLGVDGDD
jgi:hypothetical protein